VISANRDYSFVIDVRLFRASILSVIITRRSMVLKFFRNVDITKDFTNDKTGSTLPRC